MQSGPRQVSVVSPLSSKRIAVIASLGSSLVNFRFELLKRMVRNGHEVLALAPEIEPETAALLSAEGIKSAAFPMARTGTNLFEDIKSLRALTRILSDYRPDVTLPYTMKPIIYGTMAARRAGVPHRYALFTGLGYTFSEDNPSGKRALVRSVAIRLYRHAMVGAEAVFAYNPAEEADIRRFRLVAPSVPVIQVPGSGVDTDRFEVTPPPRRTGIRFLMISRVLKSKGVQVYVEAARMLRQRGIEAEVCLLGPLDINPDAISKEQLDAWIDEGAITYLGATSDVRPHIAEANVIVLPAIHREGIPRTILEAMAMGRAVITTDVPGCAHSIEDGRDGIIVKAGDADALADAMARLAGNAELTRDMGLSGRRHAETTFDVHSVNGILLRSMGLE